ncbi:hypothetical protein [Rhizobiales bacterium]
MRKALVLGERIFFLVVAALLFSLAYSEIAQSARFANVFVIAERLEKTDQASKINLSKILADTGAIVDEGFCRSDILMAGATIALRHFDEGDEIADYAAWSKALAFNEKYFRHAISCMPSNSNFWLRLAMTRAVQAEEPTDIARLMSISVRLAPADQFSLIARLYFWNHLSAATLKAASRDLRKDLKTLFTSGDPKKIAAALPIVSDALLPYLLEATRDMVEDRKKSFSWEGLDIKKLGERYAHNENSQPSG